MDRVDCVVVGAGVVGLAVARALALAGREVVIVERERQFGTGISSRNSEVVHAGIYYPQGSLKARLCVEGRHRLYAFCTARGIPFQRCGKLIVAANAGQEAQIEALAANGAANGVDDLAIIGRSEALAMEPELACIAAMVSPSTGIVDSHAFMLALLGEAEAHGAVAAFGNAIARIDAQAAGFAVTLAGDTRPALVAGSLVNSAGLHAPALARAIAGLDARHIPETYFAKGSYFALSGRAPFSHLIYPVPEPGGLGVHATFDLGGRVKFGPDVEWCDRIDYGVDAARADAFYERIRVYWPGLPDGALVPDYCGIRPKVSGPGEPAGDFVISGAADHGLPGLVNLFGIESPGLTAALAIADHVEALVRR